MNLPRWLSVILMMGLILVLSPLSAQAWRNQPNFQQPQHRAFTPHQPRGNAFGWHGQRPQWHQPRGNAFGWHGQQSQWHQPRGNAYGWHGQQSRWHQPRHSFAQGHHPGHRQFQHPYMGQPHNSHFPYARAPYPGHSPAPNFAPRAPGYPHSPFAQVGQSYPQPGFHHPGAPWNSYRPVAQEQPTVIQSLD